MQVTSYQMHSVLESYSRKLSRGRRTGDVPARDAERNGVLSAEGRREATMDKISRQVLEKISDVVSLSRPPEAAVGVGNESTARSKTDQWA